ncbi:Putative Speedy protein E4, partial [Heterocephalus glaber]
VEVDDEIPGQSGVWVAPRLLPQVCAQKWKRDGSSGSEEELQEDLLGLFNGAPGPVPLTHTGIVEKPCGLKRKMKRKHLSSVLPEHEAFTRLLKDPVIKRFLAWDINLKASDKNLLAMVIVYFGRAGLFPWKYQRIHFLLVLYLASDMENHQEPKLYTFFISGTNFDKIPQFHKLRYQFICYISWTREGCEEIQAYDPTLWEWA